MKPLLVFLFFLSLAASCKKAGERSVRAGLTGIEGAWLAHDYILATRDGGSWHPLTGDQEVISFDKAGKGTIFSNGVQSSGYYLVTGDSTLDIVGGAFTTHAWYSLSQDTLSIAGPCTEACVTRYVRAKED